MNVQMIAWSNPRYDAHPDPPQVHLKLRGGKNRQVQHTHSERLPVLLVQRTSKWLCACVGGVQDSSKKEKKKKKKGPVLERRGGGGSDGGRNSWTLDRRKTWSIRPFLWVEIQRPSSPQPTRTSVMASILFPCTQKQPKVSSDSWSDLEHVHAVFLCLCVLGGVCVRLGRNQSFLVLRVWLHQRRFLQRELFIGFWQVLDIYDPVVSL